MRATKAYIASLGTTGVMLAASILMLAVVSAVVAFDRWPNGNLSTRVQTVVLRENAARIRVSSNSAAPSAATGARPTAAAAPGAAGGAALAAPRTTGGASPRAGATVPAGNALPAVPAVPAPPALPSTAPLLDPISNPGTATSNVADGVQSVTDSTGVSVGQVSPQVGDGVTQAGQTAADAVRALPLPGH